MKKRLLITSALMTAVLGASLATGTYAWYQAAAGSATVSQATADISTSTNEYAVGGITLVLSVTNSGTPDLVNEDGETYYFSGANLVDDTEGNVKYGTLTLGVTCAASANDRAAYAGTYNVVLTDDEAAGKILFSTGTTPYSNGTDDLNLTVTISADGSTVSISETTVYYSVMADEENPEEEVEAVITLKQAA